MGDEHQGGAGGDKGDVEAFERKQAEELKEFEANQRLELEEFERKEAKELKDFEEHEDKVFHIKIDRTEYKVHQMTLTGIQLRNLATPPIGSDRDLFEVVPGGSDLKIADTDVVKMRDGLRFFTAPAQINPGRY